MNDWSDDEINDPLVADVRNLYKVEKWTRDGTKVDSTLYAANSLGRGRSVFEHAIKHRPRIGLTIRHGRGCWTSGRTNEKPQPEGTGAKLSCFQSVVYSGRMLSAIQRRGDTLCPGLRIRGSC